MLRILMILGLLCWSGLGSAYALDPDEPLADPVLETRARALSKELRCVVCQNQSIDESDADLARAMRVMVRKHLLAGDSDSDIVQLLQDRYGDAIRLMPPFKASTYVLWLAPFVFVVLGGLGWWRLVRLRQPMITNADPDESPQTGDSLVGDEVARPPGKVWAVIIGVVVVLSGGVYSFVGHPDVPDQPFVPRLAQKLGVSERAITNMQAMVTQLTQRLEQVPTDGQAWAMLGRANRYLDRHGEAVIALERAVAYGQDDAKIVADLAESLVIRHGKLTLRAKEMFARALLKDASEPRAAWFMAQSALQDGKPSAAIGILQQAAAAQPQTSVWYRRLTAQAHRLQAAQP